VKAHADRPQADRPSFGTDPKPYYLAVGVLCLLELVRRAFLGYVPDDFTAYLSAADVFAAGQHPYGEAGLAAERYAGKPYNYLPGTLYFIWPLHALSTATAVALDWVARCAALLFALRVMWRRIAPDLPFQFVLLVAVAHQPLLVDLLFGNVTTYLLAAWAGCVWVAHRPRTVATCFAAAFCGLVLSFKPFWVLSGLFVLGAKRRWVELGCAAAGAAVVVVASLPFLDILGQYRDHLAAMAEFYYSVALMTFAPALIPVVAAAWLAAGVALVRRNPGDAWIWSACAIVFWPRLGTYSYTMTLPVVLFFIARWGWLRGLAASAVLVGPIPWLLRTAPGFEKAFLLEAWTHWIWVWLAAVAVFVSVWRLGDRDTVRNT